MLFLHMWRIGHSYLMFGGRCLRLVCDLWTVFLEFPACEKSPTPLPPKRRKIYLETGFADASLQNNLTPSPVEMKFKDQPRSITQRLSLEAAKECLLSLKASIDSLNQKNLFPYNPKVLLRRYVYFKQLNNIRWSLKSVISKDWMIMFLPSYTSLIGYCLSYFTS